jgi:prephenate dehydratase
MYKFASALGALKILNLKLQAKMGNYTRFNLLNKSSALGALKTW